jgi:putative sterol carrier protein
MADPTSEFLDKISQPSQRRLMGNVTGTIRIDLDRGKATEHYLLTIDKGNISVSTDNVKADATVHTDKELFDKLASGEANAMASVLRGLISAEGDPKLVVMFQRLFPGPPNARATQPTATQEARPA